MGPRKGYQEFHEDSMGRVIKKIVNPHPISSPYTADKSDLPEEYHKPRTREET